MSWRQNVASCAGLLALALVAGCSLLFSEASEDEDDPIPTIEGDVYISPNGDDSLDGKVPQRAVRTWAVALSRLSTGEILVVLPGVYSDEAVDGEPTGLPNIDCESTEDSSCEGGCENGSIGAPIVVKASSSRQAILRPSVNWTKETLKIERCSAWQIEGLVLEGVETSDDEAEETNVVSVSGSFDIGFRDVVVHKDNKAGGGQLFSASAATNVTIEDSGFYDFRNKAMVFFRSPGAQVRRVHVSGLGSSTGDSFCPNRGDIAIQVTGSPDAIFDNVVVEGVCDGLVIQPVASVDASELDVSSDATVVGSMIEASSRGIICQAGCNSCPEADQTCCDSFGACQGLEVSNSVIRGAIRGLSLEAPESAALSQLTIFDATEVGIGIYAEEDALIPAAQSAAVTQSLLIQTAIGVDAQELPNNTTFSSSNVPTGESVLPVELSNATIFTMESNYGGCFAQPSAEWIARTFLNEDRLMVGANIIHRSQAGEDTTTPLWTPDGFPCGVNVPNVTDKDDAACSSLHARFGIGLPSCPLPLPPAP